MFDALAHIDDSRVKAPQDVLQRAHRAGVSDVLIGGVDPLQRVPQRWSPTAETPRVHRAYGLHPQAIDAFAITAQLDALADRLSEPDVVAIGEIGLDDRPGMPPLGLQEMVLRTQLRLALVKDLPVVLHLVGKPGLLVDLLQEAQDSGETPLRGMIHAFPGPQDLIRRLTKLGIYFSFGGQVTRSAHKRCRLAAARVPEDRLLVESDCPDHPPAASEAAHTRPTVREQSEPALLPLVLAELQRLRPKISEAPRAAPENDEQRVQRLGEITGQNARRLFLGEAC